MISEIRSALKTQGFRVILWVVIISMIIGYTIVSREGNIQKSFLQINRHDISRAAFEQQLHKENERIQLLRQSFGAEQADLYLNLLGMSDPKILAFNSIVRETLLNDVAKKMNLDLSEHFIVQQLQNPSFVMNSLLDLVPVYIFDQHGVINKDKLNQYLRYTGQSMGQFEESLENILKRIFVTEIIGTAAYIMPEAIMEYFTQFYRGKQFEVVKVPLAIFEKKFNAQQVDEQTLKNFFDQENKRYQRYMLPEKRAGKALVFDANKYGITVTDAEIQSYYNAHKSQFVDKNAQITVRRILFIVNENDPQKVEEQARNVLTQLREDPTQFEALAKQYSQDTQTAQQGGLMPAFSKGQQDPMLEKTAFALRRDGQISDIIATKDGLEIIQRVSRTPAIYKKLEHVKDEITEKLIKQKFKTKFVQDIPKVLRQVKTNLDALANFAQSKQAQEQDIAPMANDQSPKAEKLFKLKQGEWGYYIANGDAVVLQVTEIQKSHAPEFSAVMQKVKDDYSKAQAENELQKAIEEAKHEAQSKSMADIAKELGGTFKQTEFLTVNDQQAIQQLEKEGMPLTDMLGLSNPGTVISVKTPTDSFIIKLVALEPINQETYQEQKSAITKKLYQEEKARIEGGFIASLSRNATIKSMDPEFNIGK